MPGALPQGGRKVIESGSRATADCIADSQFVGRKVDCARDWRPGFLLRKEWKFWFDRETCHRFASRERRFTPSVGMAGSGVKAGFAVSLGKLSISW